MHQEVNNSILENSTTNDVINTIQLEINADIDNNLQVIIVEGDTDILFLRDKIKKSNTLLKQSHSGWIGVEKIINYFSNNQVIGICDRDYLEITSLDNSRLFYYDYSCLEMMMIASEDVCNTFIPVYYYDTRSPIEVRDFILSSLFYLSCFRQQNAKHSWGINFDGISFSNIFISPETEIGRENLLGEIRKINTKHLQKVEEKKDVLNELLDTTTQDNLSDLLHITNGHDFMGLFQVLHAKCSEYRGKCQNAVMLEIALCASYRMSDFINTTLYQLLKQHEETYNRHFMVS